MLSTALHACGRAGPSWPTTRASRRWRRSWGTCSCSCRCGAAAAGARPVCGPSAGGGSALSCSFRTRTAPPAPLRRVARLRAPRAAPSRRCARTQVNVGPRKHALELLRAKIEKQNEKVSKIRVKHAQAKKARRGGLARGRHAGTWQQQAAGRACCSRICGATASCSAGLGRASRGALRAPWPSVAKGGPEPLTILHVLHWPPAGAGGGGGGAGTRGGRQGPALQRAGAAGAAGRSP